MGLADLANEFRDTVRLQPDLGLFQVPALLVVDENLALLALALDLDLVKVFAFSPEPPNHARMTGVIDAVVTLPPDPGPGGSRLSPRVTLTPLTGTPSSSAAS